MTSAFQAYLQQELEKLQDLRNKAKLEGEPWDERVSGSLGQNSHLVSKATRQWESLLARKSKYKLLVLISFCRVTSSRLVASFFGWNAVSPSFPLNLLVIH